MLRAADVDAAELERSIDCFDEVLHLSEQSGMPLESANAHAALGVAYQMRLVRDLDRAVVHLHAALEVLDRDTAPQQWVQIQGYLARALAKRGRADAPEDGQAAIEALEGALEVAGDQGMAAAARDTADLLAELHAERGTWSAAAKALDASIAWAEDLYAASLLLSSRRAELEHAGERFARRAYVGVRAGEDTRTAVELLERGRARALGEALGRDRADLESLASSHPEVVERFRAAASQVRQLDVAETAFGTPALPRAGSSYLQRQQREELQAALRARVTQARESFADALHEVRHLAGDTSLLVTPGFGQIAAIDPSVVIAYLRATRWGGIALLVHGGDVESIELPGLSDGELLERVRAYAVAESRHGRDPVAFSSALDEVARWSWEVAVGDLIARLERDARIVVIAGGLLGVLPLHAAWTPDATARCGRLYAIDRVLMSYAPSARAMAEAWRVARPGSAMSMLAIDDPQPVTAAPLLHAGHEAAAACAAFAEPARRLSGEQASTAAVLDALPRAAVLHLACHAQADGENPWNSGILMAHDDALRLRDLQSLRLHARLAVLSACETAQTGYRLLDEAIGMPGALLEAGVGAVIASLWRVSDEATMLLMTDFYERWRADPLRPAAALRGAQLWLRDATGAEKRLRFEALLDGDGDAWLPHDVARACYMAVALDEPDELGHAAPTEWAAFSYVGA
jgi:CHAT domain-containing protein